MKFTLAGIIAVSAILSAGLFAEPSATGSQNHTEYIAANSTQNLSKVALSIAFFDRTMYYPGDGDINPVNVRVSMANHGADTVRFKIADDRMFSIDFTGLTVKNRQLKNTDELNQKRTTSRTVYFRDIVLEPGEEYSFVENVKDYLKIDEPSVYYIELKLYPELYQNKSVFLSSNRLSLDVRPSPSAASSTILPVQGETAIALQPEAISPDKVVEQTIIARQRSLWDQYFLYMDVEKMLMRNPVQNRKYRASSADERGRMLANYKNDLKLSRIDRDIVAVPQRFEIERTSYDQTAGTVSVLEWFQYPTYTERKRYTYHVIQRDGIWLIDNYTVDNLGTE